MDEEKHEYAFAYKCRLCGGIELNPHACMSDFQATSEMSLILTGHRPAIRLVSFNHCADMSRGLTDLQGFQRLSGGR